MEVQKSRSIEVQQNSSIAAVQQYSSIAAQQYRSRAVQQYSASYSSIAEQQYSYSSIAAQQISCRSISIAVQQKYSSIAKQLHSRIAVQQYSSSIAVQLSSSIVEQQYSSIAVQLQQYSRIAGQIEQYRSIAIKKCRNMVPLRRRLFRVFLVPLGSLTCSTQMVKNRLGVRPPQARPRGLQYFSRLVSLRKFLNLAILIKL